MSSWKEKIQSSKKKIQKSIHSKSFWKHFFLMAVIVLAAGIVLSMIPAKVTTINDMAIRYTEPQTEELETEGFAEETEAEQSHPKDLRKKPKQNSLRTYRRIPQRMLLRRRKPWQNRLRRKL